MITKSNRPILLIGVIAVFLSVTLIGCGIVSGNFLLSQESPMPSWFNSEEKIVGTNYVVEITLYEAYAGSPGKIKIKILNSSGKSVANEKGTWQWHPVTLEKRKEGDKGYPRWLIVKIKNTTEIYEKSQPGDKLKIVTNVS